MLIEYSNTSRLLAEPGVLLCSVSDRRCYVWSCELEDTELNLMISYSKLKSSHLCYGVHASPSYLLVLDSESLFLIMSDSNPF